MCHAARYLSVVLFIAAAVVQGGSVLYIGARLEGHDSVWLWLRHGGLAVVRSAVGGTKRTGTRLGRWVRDVIRPRPGGPITLSTYSLGSGFSSAHPTLKVTGSTVEGLNARVQQLESDVATHTGQLRDLKSQLLHEVGRRTEETRGLLRLVSPWLVLLGIVLATGAGIAALGGC